MSSLDRRGAAAQLLAELALGAYSGPQRSTKIHRDR